MAGAGVAGAAVGAELLHDVGVAVADRVEAALHQAPAP